MNENHYTKHFFFIQQQNKNTKLFILHASKVKLTQYPTRYKNNMNKGNNIITELRTILQRESQNS
jgi:hypothetical protein